MAIKIVNPVNSTTTAIIINQGTNPITISNRSQC